MFKAKNEGKANKKYKFKMFKSLKIIKNLKALLKVLKLKMRKGEKMRRLNFKHPLQSFLKNVSNVLCNKIFFQMISHQICLTLY